MTKIEQTIRALEIKVQLERVFAERGIAANRRDFLLKGVDDESSSAAHAYIVGSESRFDVNEITDQIARSERGQLALAADEQRAVADSIDAELTRLAELPPAQRIAEARKLGLV